jgi:hypothetical protein
VQDGEIIIRPAQHPRQDWAAAFRAMAESGDDRLLDGSPMIPTRWDEDEWQW